MQQVLNIGALDGQAVLPAQEWEEVKRKGDEAVEGWINKQMNYKQAVVVMIGTQTASRKFVKYEIRRAWALKKPLLGIRIHGLKDATQNIGAIGPNPFEQFGFNDSTKTFANYVPVFDPANYTGKSAPLSTDVYAAIKNNIGSWVDQGYRRP